MCVEGGFLSHTLFCAQIKKRPSLSVTRMDSWHSPNQIKALIMAGVTYETWKSKYPGIICDAIKKISYSEYVSRD